jgi:hypothetical protein
MELFGSYRRLKRPCSEYMEMEDVKETGDISATSKRNMTKNELVIGQ